MKIRSACLVMLSVATIACGDEAADTTPMDEPSDPADLFVAGSFEVGYDQYELSYTPPGSTEARVLPIKVWYPAAPDSGAEPAEYSVGGIITLEAGNALAAPPIAPESAGSFPVSVYSHGSGGEGLLAYPFAEHFASQGWVVVSPNHVGNTALDGISGNFAPFAANTLYRVTDITAVLDQLETGGTGVAVDGRVDVESSFLFGHSFGGYTTLAAGGADYDYDGLLANCATYDDGSCELLEMPEVVAAFEDFGDARLDAIVPQAPALVPGFEDGEIAAIEIPTMIQSGDLDVTTTNDEQAEPAWDALDGENDVWIRLPRGAHFSFITICDDLEPDVITAFQPNAFEDGCGEDFIPVSESVPALNAYMRAFVETHVLGSSEWAAVLDGSVSLDEGLNVVTP